MMKQYFTDGLLPYAYIEEVFERTLCFNAGTLRTVFVQAVRDVIEECDAELYIYTYELEGYINDRIRKGHITNTFTLSEVLKTAFEDYMLEVLHDNIYTFLENYLSNLLNRAGFSESHIQQMNLLEIIGYATEDTSLSEIRKKARAYARFTCYSSR